MWWLAACNPETSPRPPAVETTADVRPLVLPDPVRLDRPEVSGAIPDLDGDGAADLWRAVSDGSTWGYPRTEAYHVELWPDLASPARSLTDLASQHVGDEKGVTYVGVAEIAPAGDLDADGRPDLWASVAGGFGPGPWYLVPGPFTADRSDVIAAAIDVLPVGAEPLGPVDLDGEGTDDLVYSVGDEVTVCFGPAPARSRCTSRSVPGASETFAMGHGDLDHDGVDEILVRGFPIEVLAISADDLLGAPVVAMADVTRAVAHDVDGDGAADLIWQTWATVEVARGPFAAGATDPAPDTVIDGEGGHVWLLGFVGARWAVVSWDLGIERTFWMFDASRPGTWTRADAAALLPGRLDTVIVADVDADGREDVLVEGLDADGVWMYSGATFP